MNAPQTIPVATDPLQGMVGYEIRRTMGAVMNSLSTELDPLDLRPSEGMLLLALGANPGCTQSELSRALRAQPANLVPIINKLTTAGLVERVPTSGRSLALYLTDQGKRLYEQVEAAFARHEARIAGHLSDKARRDVIATLRSICKAACCGDGPQLGLAE